MGTLWRWTQGLGAINAMGKAAVQVANSLDHAVEHLFEGWSVSPPAENKSCAGVTERVRNSVPLRNCQAHKKQFRVCNIN